MRYVAWLTVSGMIVLMLTVVEGIAGSANVFLPLGGSDLAQIGAVFAVIFCAFKTWEWVESHLARKE